MADVRVVADIYEEPSGVPRHLAERHGISVEIKRMVSGDYDVGAGALVERKTVRDFHLAIIRGRFWPQVGRLRKAARFPYVLLEGDDIDSGGLTAAAVRGVCLALTDLGITLLRSVDGLDSALWLTRLAHRRQATLSRDRPVYAQRPKRLAKTRPAEAALASIPGMSRAAARSLLVQFGSLAAVVDANEVAWREGSGIGPRRARALARTFYSQHGASHSSPREEWQREHPAT